MTPKTILLSALSIGTVGGVAAGGYFFMSPSNIGELLKSKKIQLLDPNKDEDKWKILVSKHIDAKITIETEDSKNVEIEPIKGLENITNKADNEGIKLLKDKCKELLEKAITEGEQLEKDKNVATNWCSFESPMFKEKATSTQINPAPRQ